MSCEKKAHLKVDCSSASPALISLRLFFGQDELLLHLLASKFPKNLFVDMSMNLFPSVGGYSLLGNRTLSWNFYSLIQLSA